MTKEKIKYLHDQGMIWLGASAGTGLLSLFLLVKFIMDRIS